MNLYLIGYRGSGKTTVAKLLAERLSWSWIDTDHEIERRAGKSIAQIFDEDGEEAFRDLEAGVIADVSRHDQRVVALGGGAVLREENRQALRKTGRVVWLQASAETLFQRIAADAATAARRPDLTSAGGLEEINQLLQQRTPAYRDAADFNVETEGKSTDQIADEIAAWLGG